MADKEIGIKLYVDTSEYSKNLNTALSELRNWGNASETIVKRNMEKLNDRLGTNYGHRVPKNMRPNEYASARASGSLKETREYNRILYNLADKLGGKIPDSMSKGLDVEILESMGVRSSSKYRSVFYDVNPEANRQYDLMRSDKASTSKRLRELSKEYNKFLDDNREHIIDNSKILSNRQKRINEATRRESIRAEKFNSRISKLSPERQKTLRAKWDKSGGFGEFDRKAKEIADKAKSKAPSYADYSKNMGAILDAQKYAFGYKTNTQVREIPKTDKTVSTLESIKSILSGLFKDRPNGQDMVQGASLNENRRTMLRLKKSKSPTENLIKSINIEKAEKRFDSFTSKVRSFGKGSGKIFIRMLPFSTVAKDIKESKSRLDTFFRAFKRVALYKAIRGGIGAVLQGWREGITNLYQYSVRFGTQFRNTMDMFATSMQYGRNGVAAMVAPLANELMPIVDALVDRFVDLANAIGLFFAKITGQSSYSAAIKGAKKFAEATGEARRQLMGFDEINRLDANGGDKNNYGQMFEEWSTEVKTGSFVDKIKSAISEGDWKGAGGLLAERLNEMLNKVNVSDLGKRLGDRIKNFISLGVGLLEKFNFADLGKKVAEYINAVIEEIEWTDFGRLMADGITSAIDALLGLFGGLNWKEVGDVIGGTFTGFFDALSDWLDEVDWFTLGNNAVEKLVDFVLGLDVPKVVMSLFRFMDSAFSACIQLFGGLGSKVLGYVWDGLVGAIKIVKTIGTTLWTAMKESIEVAVDSFKSLGKQILDYIINKMNETLIGRTVVEAINGLQKSHESERQLTYGSGRIYTETRAEGGTVPKGQLFIANEAGPELVGQVSGKTTVTNQEQFVQAMASVEQGTQSAIYAMANAIVNAINSQDYGATVTIGDRDIVNAYRRGTKTMGQSLVEV